MSLFAAFMTALLGLSKLDYLIELHVKQSATEALAWWGLEM